MAGHRRESIAERRERRAAIDDPEVVFNASVRYLEMRARSVAELRRYLATKGYRPELVDGAIERLLRAHMLDDEQFARAWVESRDRARPRSESVLRRELALKGIDRQLAGEILAARRGIVGEGAAADDHAAGIDPDFAAAERLLRKKLPSLARLTDPRERSRRAYSLLARNGFDPDTARQTIASVLAAGAADEDPNDADGASAE